jgi:hypothetical protein
VITLRRWLAFLGCLVGDASTGSSQGAPIGSTPVSRNT